MICSFILFNQSLLQCALHISKMSFFCMDYTLVRVYVFPFLNKFHNDLLYHSVISFCKYSIKISFLSLRHLQYLILWNSPLCCWKICSVFSQWHPACLWVQTLPIYHLALSHPYHDACLGLEAPCQESGRPRPPQN